MPLELRELHIKVNVGGKAPQGGGGKEGPAPEGAKEKEDGQEKLLAQCVDEVMMALRNRKER